MTIKAQELVDGAIEQTGLSDFGGNDYSEGLDRLCAAIADEADLHEMGEMVTTHRLSSYLVNRLRIEDTYRQHPDIGDRGVDAPVFILGLPRSGTTATSNLLSVDPGIRSLRVWESSDPVPPPEAATQDDDPRIAATRAGLEAMDAAFPRMKSLYYQSPTGPTECQDLLGMTFRAEHFDGLAHVPTYVDWVVDCDMAPAYRYHRRTLQLLQWKCPPYTWHLKTPVHMLSLDALDKTYPDARFIWTHRDPAAVLGSVCELITYTRSWVSDRRDDNEIGTQQLGIWTTALRRAVEFRDHVGEARFADLGHAELQTDPVGALERVYDELGLPMTTEARTAMSAWVAEHPGKARGTDDYGMSHFALDPAAVRDAFAFYLDRFDIPAAT